MKNKILLLLCITIVATVFLSGCLKQGPPTAQYKNDIITIEEYYISDLTPYADSEVVIEFLVQNNGENPVSRVKVRFFEHQYLEIVELKCMGTEPEGGDTCVFDKGNKFGELMPSDVRKIDLRLRAPSKNIIKKPTNLLVRYYIEYDYGGFRKMDLPIIDGETVRTPSTRYSQSTPTYGPIRLTFEAPERGEHKENGKVVKDYWGVKGQPFEVKMKLADVASASLKDNSPIINAGDIKLDLKNSLQRAYYLDKAGTKTMLPCDFCVGGEGNCPGSDPNYLYSNKTVKVPGELKCNFQSFDFTEPELLATIWADFSYTYQYTITEELEVQPLE